MSTDTQAVRLLMERLRSVDEHEAEAAIGHLLEQADVGVFERMADELDAALARIEELEKVVELGKALLFQSELKEDKAAYEEWYEVAVPEWEDLRDALAALGGEE